MLKYAFIKNTISKKFNFYFLSLKNFRDFRDDINYAPDHRYKSNRPNPYQPQFTLTEEEKIENEKLPVEERVLDFQKYMKHKGKLKYSTGKFLIDVEPFPRLKIMMLCDILINELKKIPDTFRYKLLSHEWCKYVMKVVDENESIIDIESKITNVSSAEELIMALHNEVTLIQTLAKEKPWIEIEKYAKDTDLMKSFYFATAAFREHGNPDFSAPDSFKYKKNEKPERPATAGQN